MRRASFPTFLYDFSESSLRNCGIPQRLRRAPCRKFPRPSTLNAAEDITPASAECGKARGAGHR